MTEPCSTGIGGDMFCLYYEAKTGKVSALNGSGRAGAACTLETVRASLGLDPQGADGKIPMASVHAVSVPGAAAGWCDAVERFGSGKLGLDRILAPAAELGEKGFPVSELTAHYVSLFLSPPPHSPNLTFVFERIWLICARATRSSGILLSGRSARRRRTAQRC